MSNSGGTDPQQQQQAAPAHAAMGQPGMANMAAFGYGSAANQEALMNMIRQGQGGMPGGMAMAPGGFPPGAFPPTGQAPGGVDANGQPMAAPSDGQTPQMPPNAMQAQMGAYPGMFDPSQMQGMAGFPGFPGMPGQHGGFMDPSQQMFLGMQQAAAQGADPQNAAMSQASAALGQAQANTMNSSAALAQGMAGMNPAAMAGAPGMMGQQGMMNPMMGDPNMLLRFMQQQQAGAMFGAPQPGAQAGMFGLGAGLSGAAGLSAASYLNMAQQAGANTGGADPQMSMMMGAGGAGGGAVLNPFARPGKPPKQRKSKNKPKRPLSAYNIFFKDERARILSGIPNDEEKKTKKVKKEEGEENGEEDVKKEAGEKEDAKKKDDDDVKKEDGGEDAEKKKGEDDASASKAEEGAEEDGENKEGDKEGGDGKAGKKRKRVPHGKIGFESLAKIIGRRWKELPPEELEDYKKRAEVDMKRYRKEMEGYLQKQREGLEQSREHLESMAGEGGEQQQG